MPEEPSVSVTAVSPTPVPDFTQRAETAALQARTAATQAQSAVVAAGHLRDQVEALIEGFEPGTGSGTTPQFSIGTVETGDTASVTLSGTDEAPVLNFVLPRGLQGETGADGDPGTNGLDAYALAVANGFVGDLAAWLDSLKGAKGDKGDPGEGVPTGGTTGQILAKSSNSDFATVWVNPPEGTGGGEVPADVEGRLSALEADNALFMEDVDEQVAARWPHSNQWAGGSFQRWAFAIYPQGGKLDAVRMFVDSVSSINKYIIRFWLRDTGASYTGAPSEANGDVLARTNEVMASTFPQVATHQVITFEFPVFEVPAGKFLIWDVQAQKADLSFGPMGIGRVDGVQGITQAERGYYQINPSSWALMAASGAAATIAFVAYMATKALDGSSFRNLPPAERQPGNFLIDSLEPKFTFTGLAVTVSGRFIKDREAVALGSTVSAAAAPTGSETKTVNLAYSTSDAFVLNNVNPWLERRNLSNVVVRRASDNALLVAGTDYAVNTRNGKLRGIPNVTAYSVNVTYNYAQERYDLLQIDALTNTITMKAGTARDFDAQEYTPSADAGKLPLALVRVIGGAINAVIPVWQFNDVIQKDTEQDWFQLRYNNKLAIAKTLGKLQRGEPVKIAGYGDSITAFQTGAPTDGSQYQPNGQWRDRDQYFVLYPADTKAANLQYFDTGDGAGAVHIRKGWNWELVKFWQKKYASTITYLNFGIGSTASHNSANNGLWPARIAPLVAAAPDLCVIGFGMNELGQAITMTNVISIIEQLQAVGTECVVIGVPLIAPDNPTTIAQWRLTNRALFLAARHTKSAYAPINAIADPRTIAGLRMSAESVSASNLYNHPGFKELEQFGKLLIAALE